MFIKGRKIVVHQDTNQKRDQYGRIIGTQRRPDPLLGKKYVLY